MHGIRNYISRNEVWIALCLIVIVNALFIGGIASGILPHGLYYKGRFLLLGATLGAVVLAGSGIRGVIDLLRPMLRWEIPFWWYLVAFLWAASVATLVLIGKGVVTGKGLEELTMDFSVVRHTTVVAAILLGAFVGEIVWVSYAIRKLSSRFTPFVGSQIVGFVWTLWWMPMVILNIGVIPDLPPLALLVSMLGIAAMCSFVYSHTKSGIAVLILQIMVNSGSLIFPVIPTTGGVGTFVAYSIVYYLCVLLLYLRFGPRPILQVNAQKAEAIGAGG